MRLDDVVYTIGHPPPDVIKIDIEGGAVKALHSMIRILAEFVPVMLMELHGPEEQQVAWDMLLRLGYCLHYMRPDYPVVSSRSDLASRWRQHIVAISHG